jgi:hypothetical protein
VEEISRAFAGLFRWVDGKKYYFLFQHTG